MRKSGRTGLIWITAIMLFVSVCATTNAWLDRLNPFLLDDSGAISLLTGEVVYVEQEFKTVSLNVMPFESRIRSKAGFQVVDDKGVWTTSTPVDIFKVSYENGVGNVFVQSSDGDKIIAPGTSNSYTFKLKNTGDVALDYTVSIDAYFEPLDLSIPIETRLNRYDGLWVVGDLDSYGDVATLDVAEDSAVLGAGRYTYYTLEWRWPFEKDNNFDTLLGNRAMDEDLTFTIVINTIASGNENAHNPGGIMPPNTADNSNLVLWVSMSAFSLLMLLFLLLYKREEEEEEA